MRRVAVLALVMAACEGGRPETRVALGAQSGQSLVGAWDAKLSLLRPYQLEVHEPAVKRICGTIGFVENHYAKGGSVLPGNAPGVGVYDLDLSLLGLNWLGDNSFPSVVVSAFDDFKASDSLARDSVSIVLNPGSQERIVLVGRHDVAGVSGQWIAQSSRGTAGGSFSLTPHVSARDQSAGC
jgi:hypothetical protein